MGSWGTLQTLTYTVATTIFHTCRRLRARQVLLHLVVAVFQTVVAKNTTSPIPLNYFKTKASNMNTTPQRRELRFQTLDEAVADATQLANGQVRTTGNHSFGQILEHLARTHDMATGLLPGPKMPFFMRLMMPFVKKSIIKNVKPGFKLPPTAEAFFWPDQEFDVQESLAHLKRSVECFNTEGPLPTHPVFGKLTKDCLLYTSPSPRDRG